MSAEEKRSFQEAQIAAFRNVVEERSSAVREAVFRQSFGLIDLLWFGLAAVTAFKIGAGQG